MALKVAILNFRSVHKLNPVAGNNMHGRCAELIPKRLFFDESRKIRFKTLRSLSYSIKMAGLRGLLALRFG